MNQNEKIRVLYVQPGKYPEEIKIPNTLETFQKYVCGSIESVRLDRDAYIICNDEGKLLPLPPNRLYGPTDFFAGPFLICGDGGEDRSGPAERPHRGRQRPLLRQRHAG